MYISFDFCSPESARVYFELPNVEDETLLFRVGVIKRENDRLIAYWQKNKSGSEWLTHIDLMQGFREQALHRGDTIRVEKKCRGRGEVQRSQWNTDRIWPVNAENGSMIEASTCF